MHLLKKLICVIVLTVSTLIPQRILAGDISVGDKDFPDLEIKVKVKPENSAKNEWVVSFDGKEIQAIQKMDSAKSELHLFIKPKLLKDETKHQIKVYSENQSFETEFTTPAFYTTMDFLVLLGALGLFLFGMKFMSEGIQKAAGEKLRDILGLMTKNRFLAVMTGFLVTSVIQSSSATTVMVVSFTNAGLFSLAQAIGVIMGANIGTTITGWIISILGLKVSVAALSLPILGIAFPFLFFANDKMRNWAEFFIGFALLFIGLDELKHSVPDVGSNPELLGFLKSWAGHGFTSTILFVLIGTVLTIVVQSSSASMALTLVLLNNGWIDFQTGAAMILGENIGTTITAQLAALIANLEAKRAAMAHTLFNLIGVGWMLVLFNPFLHFVNWILVHGVALFCGTSSEMSELCRNAVDIFSSDPEVVKSIGPIGLSIFHTTFNLTNTLLLVWFVKSIESMVKKIIPTRTTDSEQSSLKYIGTGMMGTPEFAIIEAKKEIKEFGHLTFKMFRYVQMILFRSPEKVKKIVKRVNEFEEECDREEIEISQYLARVSMQNLSSHASKELKSMWTMISELERIGDIAQKLTEIGERKIKQRIEFSDETEQGIKEMFDLVEEAFDIMLRNLGRENTASVPFDVAQKMEEKINDKRNELRNKEFILIENDTIAFQTGLLAIDIVSNCEKIGDHIFNVNQASSAVK